jgi:hypothetical protein
MNNIIDEEIQKNGNTNLITNSGLKTDSQIFAVGDSHSIFFYNSMKIKEHWGFETKIPLTIYTLLINELIIYEIGNILGNGHEKYNIKENDFVIFYYGYNDVQRNINLHYKNNWEPEINSLFSNYVYYIKNISEKYKINPIISCVYPNPRPDAQGQNPSGTIEERIMYIKYANKILNLNCDLYNIPFLNIYDYITDTNGFIKENITTDCIHLDYNNDTIRNYVEKEIYKFCV